MSVYDEVTTQIQREIDSFGEVIVLSPTVVALAVQKHFSNAQLEPHIAYASLEHLKQLARRSLAGRYDPEGDDNKAHQGDMFSGHLQERYPIPRAKDDEPQYKQRTALTDDELQWNCDQLCKSANARLRHADALRAWGDNRKFAA
jgi:hypothetical protein